MKARLFVIMLFTTMGAGASDGDRTPPRQFLVNCNNDSVVTSAVVLRAAKLRYEKAAEPPRFLRLR
jgi:hypothetical protein